jgi:hypothetical protein
MVSTYNTDEITDKISREKHKTKPVCIGFEKIRSW